MYRRPPKPAQRAPTIMISQEKEMHHLALANIYDAFSGDKPPAPKGRRLRKKLRYYKPRDYDLMGFAPTAIVNDTRYVLDPDHDPHSLVSPAIGEMENE